MKTVKMWLDELPFEIRKRALANIEKDRMTKIADCMQSVIGGNMTWDATPEKWAFWNEVYHGRYDTAPILVVIPTMDEEELLLTL
jgi:hypothetical protein